MSVGISTYVLSILFFCTVLYGVLMYHRKPKNKVPDYMKMDELEQTGWELVEDIKQASESYADKIQGVKKEIEHKLEELKAFEGRFKTYQSYEDILSQKQEVLESLFEKMKDELANMRIEKEEQQATLEEMKQVINTPPAQMERVKAKIDAMIEEEKNRTSDHWVINPIEDKKAEINRLYDLGYNISAISEQTGTEKGFIEVLINMKKYKKIQ